MLKNLLVSAMALALVGGISSAQPGASGVKVGAMTCQVASGWGFVFHSTRDLRCTFTPLNGDAEYYEGHITKFGVDIGYHKDAGIVWAVFAPTSDVAKGSLAGSYAGGTAGAAVGVGLGANALIGGFNKSISLQPVSIEGGTGLNVAAGIAAIELEPKQM